MLRGVWTRGPLDASGPTSRSSRCPRDRGRLLGRARAGARGADPVCSSAARVRDEVDFFGFVQGDHERRKLGGRGGELAALGHESASTSSSAAAPRDDETCVAAIRDAIGAGAASCGVDPNEAWGVGDDGRENPATGAVRPRLGRAAGAGTATSRGSRTCAAPSASKIAADQAVFTTRQLLEVLPGGGGGRRSSRAAHDAGGHVPFPPAGERSAEAHGVDVNRHAFMETEVSFLANLQVASTIPNLTIGNQVMHQLLAERLVQAPLPRLRRRAAAARADRARERLRDRPRTRSRVAHERWQRDGPYSSLGGPMTGDSVSALHEWLQRVTFDDLPDEGS